MGRYSGRTCRLAAMISMTGGFFVVEIVVGYLTNSTALIADSFHMLSDVLSLFVALIAIKVAPKPWSKSTYGYARAEVLGALVNAVFLMALCFSITIEAIQRFIEVPDILQPELMLITGCVGLVINLIGLAMFCAHGHGHAHDLSGNPVAYEKSGGHLNMKGVYLHIMADALGSIVVVASALIIWLTDWEYRMYVDPTLSLFIVALIITTAWPLLRDSSLVMLQTIPSSIDMDNLTKELRSKVTEIEEIHEFHVWQLDGDRIIASAHVRTKKLDDYHLIVDKIKEVLHNEGIHSSTVQLELTEENGNTPVGSCAHDCVSKRDGCSTCCTRQSGIANPSFS